MKFGTRGTLEDHGFARNKMWVIDDNPPPLHSNDSNGNSYTDLLFKPCEDDLKVWPHGYEYDLCSFDYIIISRKFYNICRFLNGWE